MFFNKCSLIHVLKCLVWYDCSLITALQCLFCIVCALQLLSLLCKTCSCIIFSAPRQCLLCHACPAMPPLTCQLYHLNHADMNRMASFHTWLTIQPSILNLTPYTLYTTSQQPFEISEYTDRY